MKEKNPTIFKTTARCQLLWKFYQEITSDVRVNKIIIIIIIINSYTKLVMLDIKSPFTWDDLKFHRNTLNCQDISQIA